MNVQELQTIRHHNLPIKIVVFSNDGYGMIKITQRNAGYARAATDSASGVSCPDYVKVARAYGIAAARLDDPEIAAAAANIFMCYTEGPCLLDVVIDPEQPQVPKLNPIRKPDGTLGSPSFDDLSPRL
jgi:acetolactate synthase-1/2/3 large subunit